MQLTFAVLTQAIKPSLFLPTPPMGFNNWARFECDLNQTLFTSTADAMVQFNLLAVGYNRVNIDDCWMAYQRAANGSLQWNTTLFPDGLPYLANYLHAHGFHFGIYEDAGTETCGGYPGSLGYEKLDALTFASWGIDYLKLDGCNVPRQAGFTSAETYKSIYGNWHKIFTNMTHPLIFSESAPAYFSGMANLSDWYTVMDWVPAYGQLARHSDDVATYGSGESSWKSILTNYGQEVLVARYQRPGYFNDPDFLIPDWPDLTIDEKRSQFALWASFSAPLIISAHIPNLTAIELDYLTNTDLIAVDQDRLALQATLVSQDGTWDVLTKSLENGDRLLTVLNRGNTSANYSVNLARLGFQPQKTASCTSLVKDLWSGQTIESSSESIDISSVPPHGTAVFRISPKSCGEVVPTGMFFNTKSLDCLRAAEDNSVSLGACDGTDEQVWQVKSDGSIRSLANSSLCLAAGLKAGGIVVMTTCQSSTATQQWKYYQSGNVVNAFFGNCLTEVGGGSLGTASCQHEANSQVFGLPSGVKVLY